MMQHVMSLVDAPLADILCKNPKYETKYLMRNDNFAG